MKNTAICRSIYIEIPKNQCVLACSDEYDCKEVYSQGGVYKSCSPDACYFSFAKQPKQRRGTLCPLNMAGYMPPKVL